MLIFHTLKRAAGYGDGSVRTWLTAYPIIREPHKPSSTYQVSNVCNGENAKVLGTVRRSGRCHVNSDHPAAAQRADALETAMKTLSGLSLCLHYIIPLWKCRLNGSH